MRKMASGSGLLLGGFRDGRSNKCMFVCHRGLQQEKLNT